MRRASWPRRGRSHGLLCEQFGPCRFGIALVVDGERLVLVPRRWSLFGIPLPLWLCPRTQAYESAEGSRFGMPTGSIAMCGFEHGVRQLLALGLTGQPMAAV